MPRPQPFRVIFDALALEHMEAIESKYDSLIRRTIEEQLRREPDVPTRNRKPLVLIVLSSCVFAPAG
jgi:hypothetical protein